MSIEFSCIGVHADGHSPDTCNPTGEDKDTLRLKDWFRAICRKAGYNCETERFFTINYHDTNELAADKEIPYPVDIYISHRRKPDYQKIVEIDGEYHDEPEQQRKDQQRDAAIKARYNNTDIIRFKKRSLLRGDYTEEQLREILEI